MLFSFSFGKSEVWWRQNFFLSFPTEELLLFFTCFFFFTDLLFWVSFFTMIFLLFFFHIDLEIQHLLLPLTPKSGFYGTQIQDYFGIPPPHL